MPADRSLLGNVLTKIEILETDLLAWGIVDAQLSEAELDAVLTEAAPQRDVRDALRRGLLDEVLVVQTPSGGYRTRMAETLRLLARLRQIFPDQRWWEGAPLVLDYRFVHRPRKRPRRDVASDDLVAALEERLGDPGWQAGRAMAPGSVSGFQLRSARSVLNGLGVQHDAGVMITAGTGSGKTLAFYLPALSWITESIAGDSDSWVRLLALYPRGELLKDQLRAVLQLSRRIGAVGGRPLRVGTWFGPTPRAAFWLKQGWVSTWKEQKQRGSTTGWECPFLTCPDCSGNLVWRIADVDSKRERLHCTNCDTVVDESYITLTRERASADPPDVMFTTTESLNRQLAAPDQHRAFGLRGKQTRMVLLDEVHTYEGTSGAQNALLLRRLRRSVRGPVLWSGLSATLENAEEFLAEFVGVFGDRVTHVQAEPTELEESGAEYLVALRHDPGSLTGPLSATIQAAMALTRSLDAPGSPYDPAPSSQGLFGRKTFVFTDKLDVTNRLYWDLLDAEGWWQRNRPKNRRILTLAHLRGEQQSRRDPQTREDARDRDEPGQWWWLAERLGRDLDGDEQLVVGRTSSQDAGVEAEADVIVATATLEVGYDDENVGAVLQHKAPHDLARFVQRKGRAGRDPSMRPWTVVVLSDWGRDRVHWQLYDQLFDPELEPRHLPLGNRYVLRMQAVYSTLDWLGARLATQGDDRSAWSDLAGPASVLETNAQRVRSRERRQGRAGELIREVLDGGPARDHLRAHLRRALGFDDDRGWSELDALLWGPPRPLMLAVLPTAMRRLRTAWAGEVPSKDDHGVRTRTPLREFIAGNLFDDLLLPDVEVFVPTAVDTSEYETAVLPAVRTLRELMPGNVTRHFGVSSFSRRHWVPLPAVGAAHADVDIERAYDAEYIGRARARNASMDVDLFRPTRVRLAVPPEGVRDASAVAPRWDYEITPLGVGRTVELIRSRWLAVIQNVSFHSHAVGDGVRVRRFAVGAEGSTFSGGPPQPVTVDFETSTDRLRPVALGIEFDADAIHVELLLPIPRGEPSPSERTDRLVSLLADAPSLPPSLTWFQRSAIASAVTVVIAELGGDFALALDALPDEELAASLIDALERLGMLAATDPHAVDAGGNGDGTPAGGNQQRRPMEAWSRRVEVVRAVRSAATTVSAGHDDEWVAWLRRRLAATVATTFVEAACLTAPELSSDELAIDVDPSSGESVSVWISETSPGGSGQIEHLQRAITEDPQRFGRLLDRSLEPTDLEALDGHVSGFIDAMLGSDDLGRAGRDVQNSWLLGHEEVARSFAALRERTVASGAQPSRAAWTTIVNRLLGPGSHPQLVPVARALLERWDSLEQEVGLALGAREFGALCHDDTSLDEPFRLAADTSRPRRSRTISNFFWPRSPAASRLGADVADPFGLLPAVDRESLRAFLPARPDPIAVDAWDGATQELVHAALRGRGAIDMAFRPGSEQLARRVTVALQDQPVDAAAILVYPAVVGVRTADDGSLIVSLELPEVA